MQIIKGNCSFLRKSLTYKYCSVKIMELRWGNGREPPSNDSILTLRQKSIKFYEHFMNQAYRFIWKHSIPFWSSGVLLLVCHLSRMEYYVLTKKARGVLVKWQVLGTPLRSLGFKSVRGPCRTKSLEPNFSRYRKGRTSKMLWRCVRDHWTEKMKMKYIFKNLNQN